MTSSTRQTRISHCLELDGSIRLVICLALQIIHEEIIFGVLWKYMLLS